MLKKKYTKPSLRNLGLLRMITKLSGVGSVGMLRIVPKITDYVWLCMEGEIEGLGLRQAGLLAFQPCLCGYGYRPNL